MHRTLLGLTALAGLLVSPAALAQADGCGPSNPNAVRGEIVGLKDRTGRLLVELFAPTDDGFLKGDTRSQEHPSALRRLWITPPATGPVTVCLAAPSAGRYALLVTHDRDGTPKFSVGKDGLALPGTTRLGRHRPQLVETLINVDAAGRPLTLRMQYLKGLAGFAPASDQ
ncbi:DUF2141 domain-containing protein [Sphingomonas elodea]|uniref:DUF2141 domain-containing protein n=1 Tax=Sphingomonas elodea TaxID=179878 RepID=UPI0002630A6E|nr:DUF2141 domain-containing protein [Sphingomonas elodea]